MKRFIIKKIDIYTSSLEFLAGFSIDEPTVNKCYNWPFINIAGWVVGKNRLINVSSDLHEVKRGSEE